MKPQLIVQDVAGAHNSDLNRARDRIIKGGSWKVQRGIVVLPASDTVPMKCVLPWWNLVFPPNNAWIKMAALGMEVGDAYSSAIEQILAHPELSKWEYLLTIEHDNAPPGDGIIRLLERMEAHPEMACIGGLYWTKGEGGVAQIWGDINDPVVNTRPQPPDPAGGLIECYGTGMGFNLWRLSMFKDEKIKRPWFKTLNGKDGQLATQDLSFWMEARKHGYRCAVDCSVKVGHYDLSGLHGGIPDMMW